MKQKITIDLVTEEPPPSSSSSSQSQPQQQHLISPLHQPMSSGSGGLHPGPSPAISAVSPALTPNAVSGQMQPSLLPSSQLQPLLSTHAYPPPMGTYDTMVGGPVGDTNFPQQLLHQLQQHQMMDVSFALSLSENINNLQTERKLNSEFGKLN